jgi:NitT/TauT family transport system substrate-binding protein
VPEGAKALEALLGGSVNAASATFEAVINAAARGRDLQAFVTVGISPAAALVVSPVTRRKISRIEDLKGAVVGVTSPGSPTQMLLNYLLAKHGIAPERVSVVGLGSSDARLAALERGTVDAAMVSDPAFTMLLQPQPDGTVLAKMYTPQDLLAVFGTEAYTGVVLFAPPKWLGEHPHAARGLARAIRRSLAWIHVHTPEQIQAQVPKSLQIEDAAVYIESIRRMLPAWSPDGEISREGVEAVWKMLSATDPDLRDVKLDLTKTYTNEFVSAK